LWLVGNGNHIRFARANGTTFSRDVRTKENTKKLYRHADANAITTISEPRGSQRYVIISA
jgi:hypothetical protein